MKNLLLLLLTIAALGLTACAQGEPTPIPEVIAAEEAAIDASEAAMNARSAEQDAIEAATEARAATQDVTGTAVNEAPVVRAWGCAPEWALIQPGKDAVVIDPDGDALSYHWTVGFSSPEGQQAVFEDPTLLDTFVCVDSLGAWSFDLLVSDGTHTVTDHVTVLVKP
jgi:hypothetical protein